MADVIIIVYPQGDRTRLMPCVVMSTELRHYSRASRREWPDTQEGRQEAMEYARSLARKYGLQFTAPNFQSEEGDFLD